MTLQLIHCSTAAVRTRVSSRRFAIAATVAGAALLGACSSSSNSSTTTSPSRSSPSSPSPGAPSSTLSPDGGGGAVGVLPVSSNPITNTATAQTLKIESVLVENNADATGKAVDDHLEIMLANTGTSDLSGVEVYYTFNDQTAQVSESYYATLPDNFTIPAGESRVVHFDSNGLPDHFPVNKFSLYSTSTNGLDVTVVVSADGAAPQTVHVKKDPGGAEEAD
jgi:hypothetical protein